MHDAVFETEHSAVSLPRVASPVTTRLQPGDRVALADIWVILAVVWTARLVIGWLSVPLGVFAVACFALVVSPIANRRRLTLSALDDVGPLCRKVAVAFAISSAVSVTLGIVVSTSLVSMAVATAPALLAGRALSYSMERRERRANRSNALVVGAGVIARRVVATLDEHADYGLEIIGAVDDDPLLDAAELGTSVIGKIEALPELVRSRDVDVVVVAFSSADQGKAVAAIRDAQRAGAEVWVIPRFFELGSGSPEEHLWGIPIIRLRGPAAHRPEWFFKRIFDAVVSGLMLLASAPLFAAVAAAIYLEDRGPIFYGQRRIGRNGREFDMLKFRSMRVATEAEIAAEWNTELGRRTSGAAQGPGSESRITRAGRFLRASGLDELPQLINIIKGEMSLVGPRPERPFFVEELSRDFPSFEQRHRLPVGLTGWSQVHGLRGDDTSVEERLSFDNFYIENWSIAQDLKILLRTPRQLIKPTRR